MGNNVFTIDAPLSGTFYRRPSPDEPPYVEEGDEIQAGTVVCVIESMKVFNEVRSERRGVIRKFLIEDEESVMINQPIVEVEAI